MKRRLITVILFALLAAVASSTILFKIISGNTQKTVKAATAQLVVAARDLDAGTLIAESDVREAEWPVAGESQWIRRREDIVGRGLVSPIGKGEPFAESRLAAKGAGAGLASRIPPGMRALPVHVDELTGMARFILPGMHVDVISTGASGAQNGQSMITRTILQNIEVLSTGQSLGRDAKDKPAVAQAFNLLVTPQQAEILSQAVAQTRIQLVLRNPLDKGSFLSASIPTGRLTSDAALPTMPRVVFKTQALEKAVVSVEAPRPAAPTVEVIHGTKKMVAIVGTVTNPEPK